MKKILSLLSAFLLSAVFSNNVIACGSIKPISGLDDSSYTFTDSDKSKVVDITSWSNGAISNSDYSKAFFQGTYLSGNKADITTNMEYAALSLVKDSKIDNATVALKNNPSLSNISLPYYLLANYEINESNTDKDSSIRNDIYGSSKTPELSVLYNYLVNNFVIILYNDKVPVSYYGTNKSWNLVGKNTIDETVSSSNLDDVNYYTIKSFISIVPRKSLASVPINSDGKIITNDKGYIDEKTHFIGGRINYDSGEDISYLYKNSNNGSIAVTKKDNNGLYKIDNENVTFSNAFDYRYQVQFSYTISSSV